MAASLDNLGIGTGMHPKQLQPPPNVASIERVKLNINPNESDECFWLCLAENLKDIHINVRQIPISGAPSMGIQNTGASQLTVNAHDAVFESVTEETAEALSKIFLHLPANMLQEVCTFFSLSLCSHLVPYFLPFFFCESSANLTPLTITNGSYCRCPAR